MDRVVGHDQRRRGARGRRVGGLLTLARATATAADAGTVALGGLEVNRLGLGSTRLTGPGGWGDPQDPDAARRVLRRAVELGVNFVDTADAYGPGVAESLIADALRPYPDGLVIATKGGLVRTPADRGRRIDVSPAHLRSACEASLRRLRVEPIDLYQLHWPDERVPLEESIGALAGLQAEGKVAESARATSTPPSSGGPGRPRGSCRCRTATTCALAAIAAAPG